MYEELKISHINIDIFNVFSDPIYRKEREKLLVELWGIIERNGLTTATNDIELTEVYLRVFALVSLISDFSTIVCDTTFSKDYIEWYKNAELSIFHLAQKIGTKKEFVDYLDPESFNSDAINELVLIERKNIVELLLNEFDGKRKLFLKLWNSSCVDSGLTEIKNRVTTIIDAYDWVTGGCNSLLNG